MYLWSRVARMHGNPRDYLAWAVEMTAFVNEHGDLPVTLWQGQFGMPLGTVAWSTVMESRAQGDASTQRLLANDDYWDKIDDAEDYLVPGSAEDHLRQFVHGEPRETDVGHVASVTTATAEAGRMVDAIAWGVDIAQHVESVTGVQAAFLADSYGTFGQLTWVSVVDDMDAADRSTEHLNADQGYLDMIKSGGDLFVPASGRQSLSRRIA